MFPVKRMSCEAPVAVVKANYVRQSKRAWQAVKRSLKYYAFRPGPDLAQRRWYGQDGSGMSYYDARDTLRDLAANHRYTYRIVLSTRDAPLTTEDYRAVLGEQFDGYVFVAHDNTDYPHAHVLACRDKKLSRKDLTALRAQLVERERAHALEQAHYSGKDVTPEHTYELAAPPQRPARRRVHEQEQGR